MLLSCTEPDESYSAQPQPLYLCPGVEVPAVAHITSQGEVGSLPSASTEGLRQTYCRTSV